MIQQANQFGNIYFSAADHFRDAMAAATGQHITYGGTACCPAHDDSRESLSIDLGHDRRVLVYCHAGCSIGEITDAIGMTPADLFDRDDSPRRTRPKKPEQTKTKQPAINQQDEKPKPWGKIAESRFQSPQSAARRAELADYFRVSPNVLERLRIGWSIEHGGKWTIPERDGAGEVIGIATRQENPEDPDSHKKYFYRGGTRGITNYPDMHVPAGEPLYIFEGGSDAIIGLDMGLPAIGRPSLAGAESHRMLAEYIGRLDESVRIVYVADSDDEDKVSKARAAAEELSKAIGRSITFARFADGSKDARKWREQYLAEHPDATPEQQAEAFRRAIKTTKLGETERYTPSCGSWVLLRTPGNHAYWYKPPCGEWECKKCRKKKIKESLNHATKEIEKKIPNGTSAHVVVTTSKKARLYRERITRAGGSYMRYRLSTGETVFVSDEKFKGSEPRTKHETVMLIRSCHNKMETKYVGRGTIKYNGIFQMPERETKGHKRIGRGKVRSLKQIKKATREMRLSLGKLDEHKDGLICNVSLRLEDRRILDERMLQDYFDLVLWHSDDPLDWVRWSSIGIYSIESLLANRVNNDSGPIQPPERPPDRQNVMAF